MQVTTIGLDIAKNVFQVHGIDANEKVVVRKQLPACISPNSTAEISKSERVGKRIEGSRSAPTRR